MLRALQVVAQLLYYDEGQKAWVTDGPNLEVPKDYTGQTKHNRMHFFGLSLHFLFVCKTNIVKGLFVSYF